MWFGRKKGGKVKERSKKVLHSKEKGPEVQEKMIGRLKGGAGCLLGAGKDKVGRWREGGRERDETNKGFVAKRSTFLKL